MSVCLCELLQILAMLFNVRQAGDTFASLVVDVLDQLDMNLDGKIGIKEFTDHAFRNKILVECLERAFAVRVPMSVAATSLA